MILADATADPARLGRTPIDRSTRGCQASVSSPFLRPKKDERQPAFRQDHRRRGKAGSRGALAASLRRADPRGRSADRQRGRAEAKEGRLRSAAGQLLAPRRRAGAGNARSTAGDRTSVGLRYRVRAPLRGRSGPSDKVSAALRLSFRSGPAIRRLPKRVRRGRSRRRQSRSTMRARLRRAKRCARQRCAARGSTNCSSGLPAVEPGARRRRSQSLARALRRCD